MYKEYRIDTFNGKEHRKNFFDTEQEAIAFAVKEIEKGKTAFLLEHQIDGIYDVVKEIK